MFIRVLNVGVMSIFILNIAVKHAVWAVCFLMICVRAALIGALR